MNIDQLARLMDDSRTEIRLSRVYDKNGTGQWHCLVGDDNDYEGYGINIVMSGAMRKWVRSEIARLMELHEGMDPLPAEIKELNRILSGIK